MSATAVAQAWHLRGKHAGRHTASHMRMASTGHAAAVLTLRSTLGAPHWHSRLSSRAQRGWEFETPLHCLCSSVRSGWQRREWLHAEAPAQCDRQAAGWSICAHKTLCHLVCVHLADMGQIGIEQRGQDHSAQAEDCISKCSHD